jgi:photosystem II stability/assembly factor-like uncharacterized protein
VNTLYLSTGLFDREAYNSDAQTQTPGGVGVLKSTDGGLTWEAMNEGLENLYIGSLFMHPTDPDILLAAAFNISYQQGSGIYLTTDGAQHWEHVGGRAVQAVEFAESNPQIAYAAGSNELHRSDDGGYTWQLLSRPDSLTWGPPGIDPGFPIDLQVDPRDAMRVFVNNYGGGNYLSEDGGQTWIPASEGYTGADVNGVAVHPLNPAIVYANGRSGPYVSLDGGRTWEGINPADLVSEGSVIRIDPSNPDRVLMAHSRHGRLIEAIHLGQVWRPVFDFSSVLNQMTYDDVNKSQQGIQAVAFAPSNPQRAYGGFAVNQCAKSGAPGMCPTETLFSILVSEDAGHSWRWPSAEGLAPISVTGIVVHPTDHDTVWAATTGDGVFLSTDGGETWTSRSSGLRSRQIMDLAAHPGNPEVLFAASFNDGIYKSQDGGGSWQRSNSGMDPNEQIMALVIDPLRPDVLYAGSRTSGVFLSEDGGQTWRKHNDGLRTRAINALAISSDGETLYAATLGEGVFRLSTLSQEQFDTLYATDPPPEPPSTPWLEEPFSFEDDFEDGDLEGWVLQGTWAAVDTDNNLSLEGQAAPRPATAMIHGVWLDSFTLDLKLQILEGGFNVMFRNSMSSGTYEIGFRQDAVHIGKVVGREWIHLGGGAAPLESPGWHELSLTIEGDHFIVLVDGRQIDAVEDHDLRLPEGAILFEVDGHVLIDDLHLQQLGSPAGDEEAQAEETAGPTILFSDDFEDGNLAGWRLDPEWSLAENEQGLGLLAEVAEGAWAHAWPEETLLGDFALQTRLRLDSGDFSVIFRAQEAEVYDLGIGGGQLQIARETNQERTVLAVSDTNIDDGEWHDLILSADGPQITVWVDGIEVASVVDDEPLLEQGELVIEARGRLMIDDFFLMEGLPALEEPADMPPEAAPTATSAPAAAQTPTSAAPEGEAQNLRPWIYAGTGLAIVAAVIVLVLRARKKRR